MHKLAFGLILGGTLYAPVEITKCILRDMPYFPKMTENFTIELTFIWVGYIVAMIVLATELLRPRIFSRSLETGFHLLSPFKQR